MSDPAVLSITLLCWHGGALLKSTPYLEVIDGGTSVPGSEFAQVRIEILIDGKDLTPEQERLFSDYMVRLGTLGVTFTPGTAGD